MKFDPRLPNPPQDDYLKSLHVSLNSVLKVLSGKIDSLSGGFISGHWNTATSVPTTGTWAKGDFVKNSSPSELGTAGAKYVIHGWQCVTGGTPGTWVQQRYLTGN